MIKGIKAKDIRDFEKYARKLNEIMLRIREYKINANIYVTPGQINLMADGPSIYHPGGADWHGHYDWSKEDIAICVACNFLECGKWNEEN